MEQIADKEASLSDSRGKAPNDEFERLKKEGGYGYFTYDNNGQLSRVVFEKEDGNTLEVKRFPEGYMGDPVLNDLKATLIQQGVEKIDYGKSSRV